MTQQTVVTRRTWIQQGEREAALAEGDTRPQQQPPEHLLLLLAAAAAAAARLVAQLPVAVLQQVAVVGGDAVPARLVAAAGVHLQIPKLEPGAAVQHLAHQHHAVPAAPPTTPMSNAASKNCTANMHTLCKHEMT